MRADARRLPIADDSVDLIVTSPPYFALRSYQDGGEHYDGQVGAEATPAEFVDTLIACTREWMRVLKPSGSLWVNLGDKYAGGGGQWNNDDRPDPHGLRTHRSNGGTRSSDYCRLARWRTTDPGERARAMRVEKPPKQADGQLDLLGEAS